MSLILNKSYLKLVWIGVFMVLLYIGWSITSVISHKPFEYEYSETNQSFHRLINQSSPVIVPWVGIEGCEHFKIHLANPGSFSPRALVSFPGSGNSWIRYLIECSTGIFTGSVFHEKLMLQKGLLGEMQPANDGTTILQKTHHDAVVLPKVKRDKYVAQSRDIFKYRGVLVVRNPYDALVSLWNFEGTREHNNIAKFKESKWRKFATDMAPKWATLIGDWVRNSSSLLIVKFEDLKSHPRRELTKVLDFLDVPISEERLNCLFNNEEGPFHRRHDERKGDGSSNGVSKPQYWQMEKLATSTSIEALVMSSVKKVQNLFDEYGISMAIDYKGPSHH